MRKLPGAGNIVVAPHRHDREFCVLVEIFCECDGLVDVVVLAERLGDAHAKEDDPKPPAFQDIGSLADLPHWVYLQLHQGAILPSGQRGVRLRIVVLALFHLKVHVGPY